MHQSPAEYWQANKDLINITPAGVRFPEVGLFKALQEAVTGSVFEFGCGDGRLAPAFDSELYVGYDINQHAIAQARKINTEHRFGHEIVPADTFLAYTVLLHVPDDEIESVIDLAKGYKHIVIGEIMGREWRRPGNPPVFNRDAQEYADMIGKTPRIIEIPYPRYGKNLELLVF